MLKADGSAHPSSSSLPPHLTSPSSNATVFIWWGTCATVLMADDHFCTYIYMVALLHFFLDMFYPLSFALLKSCLPLLKKTWLAHAGTLFVTQSLTLWQAKGWVFLACLSVKIRLSKTAYLRACFFTAARSAIGTHVTIDHVMPREKRCGALDSCFGPHQQSIPQLLSLAPRVYKG